MLQLRTNFLREPTVLAFPVADSLLAIEFLSGIVDFARPVIHAGSIVVYSISGAEQAHNRPESTGSFPGHKGRRAHADAT